jgi:phytanoyl-CoA hydroxylase
MVRLKELLKSWRSVAPVEDFSSPPWFDRPDALQLLEARRKTERLSDFEFESLRHWAEHGYLVLRDVIPSSDVDGMLGDLERVWDAQEPIESLVIESVKLNPTDPPGLPHKKLVTLDRETRHDLKSNQNWRVHGFHLFSESARRIFNNAPLARWASLILDRKANPYYTINFSYGSTQELHQDTAVFYVWPANYLVGAWLACQDIHQDSGPLVYYEGSHRSQLFPRFDDYPRTNLKNCDPTLVGPYAAYLHDIATRYERKTFIARRGEIFLWHGMLIHGGDAIRNPKLTRHSYVCHYIPPACEKSSEAKGPFNW